MEQEHKTSITDTCYGMTGGIRIDCSCGDYWVTRQNNLKTDEEILEESTNWHLTSVGKPKTEVQ